MHIKDIIPGQSYACQFRVTALLDQDGKPADRLEVEDIKGLGLYESVGVLMQRDLEKELVRVKDQKTGIEFVVDFANIWNIDIVEWVSSPN